MRRREFIVGLGSAGVWPLAAWAQRAERVRRVGVLWDGPGNNDPQVQPLVAALRAEVGKLGWVEGRNLRMDYRFDDGDPSRRLTYAEELVNLGPDVIFAFTGSAARAVQRATQVIPIVFVGGGDAVDNKFAGSLARPAGNITGFANARGARGQKETKKHVRCHGSFRRKRPWLPRGHVGVTEQSAVPAQAVNPAWAHREQICC
jgi:putative tryptophan/tyrosine transport system substrate-binding protein